MPVRRTSLACFMFASCLFFYLTGQQGTDCVDCGDRLVTSTCNNNCFYTNIDNGVCDDGGEGASFDKCDFGTDCLDCGDRLETEPLPLVCTETCGPGPGSPGTGKSGNGVCEDGGRGAVNDDCRLGTDCEVRVLSFEFILVRQYVLSCASFSSSSSSSSS